MLFSQDAMQQQVIAKSRTAEEAIHVPKMAGWEKATTILLWNVASGMAEAFSLFLATAAGCFRCIFFSPSLSAGVKRIFLLLLLLLLRWYFHLVSNAHRQTDRQTESWKDLHCSWKCSISWGYASSKTLHNVFLSSISPIDLAILDTTGNKGRQKLPKLSYYKNRTHISSLDNYTLPFYTSRPDSHLLIRMYILSCPE